MKDDLKKNENGRRPQFFLKKQNDNLNKIEEDLQNKNKNGRQPPEQIFEDDLKI